MAKFGGKLTQDIATTIMLSAPGRFHAAVDSPLKGVWVLYDKNRRLPSSRSSGYVWWEDSGSWEVGCAKRRVRRRKQVENVSHIVHY